MSCAHDILQLTPSPFAPLAGYQQPPLKTRLAAETKSGRAPTQALPSLAAKRPATIFPAPLVLPHDDLNYDPDCPAQSVRSWILEKERNKMHPSDARRVLYVAQAPTIDENVPFMRDWSTPTSPLSHSSEPAPINMADLTTYLSAYYHPLTTTLLPTPLSWTSWTAPSSWQRSQSNPPKHIGLTCGSHSTRVRVRRAPDGRFAAQLNLNDVIDALIGVLPDDAYALCLVVEHDLYESRDDDFCCGRAYGGSRVAVVQRARYNPVLDGVVGIDAAHAWPASHCKAFVDALCAVEEVVPQPVTKAQIADSGTGAMSRAINRAGEHGDADAEGEEDVEALWFARLAKTVAHELGHCFGMEHCTYYACSMQGTAGLEEDARQPSYLCPVCEAKVEYAVVGELQQGGEIEREAWVKERCKGLRAFCVSLEEEGRTSAMWRGMDRWLEERMKGV